MMRFSRRALSSGGGWSVVQRKSKDNQTVSTLENGLRVHSIDHGGYSASLGFFSYNGSAFETDEFVGSTAVLEGGFMKANQLLNQPQLAHRLERIGNNMKFMNHREMTCSIFHLPRYSIAEGLQLVNAVSLHPIRDESTCEEAKTNATLRLQLQSRDQTRFCFELIHQTAWAGSPLGKPDSPTEGQIQQLNLAKVRSFHERHTTPDRSLIIGLGIPDHDAFVKLVSETLQFPEMKASAAPVPMRPNKYVGGQRLEHCTEAPETTKKFEERPLTHMALCFKGVTIDDPEYFAASVIQTLLGGGTSFSSGGPGKGMHTKLFREVINREGWIHGIECVTAWYRDSGLVGLYGQCPHSANQKLLNTLIAQAATIPERITTQHLLMAKNQLQSQLILLGEPRDVMVEEAGKMMLGHGQFLVASELAAGTEKLTLEDLRRICDRMLKDNPTFVVYGNTNKLPGLEVVTDRLQAIHKRSVEGRTE